MEMKKVTLEELRKMFGQPFVRREPNGGFCIRMVGTKKPNLAIYLNTPELPVQNGAIVNPFRGFNMPEVLELMNLNRKAIDSRVGFFRRKEEKYRANMGQVTSLVLVEPEDADFILVTTSIPDATTTEGLAHNVIESYSDSIMTGSSLNLLNGIYTNQIFYELFTLGFRDTGDEPQPAKDSIETRKTIIRLAESYLNRSVKPAIVEVATIPGLSSQVTTMRFWAYEDDLSAEKSWVIDRMGRLLGYSPDLTENCISQFDPATTKIAEFRTWTNVPPDALVLSWCKPSISAKHEFIVNLEPEMPTRAQLERVGTLEQIISSAYANRISPYDCCVSPEIDDGWNLWEHGTSFGDN